MDYIFIIAKGLNSHARTALRPLYIIYLRLELIVACFCLWRDYIRVEWIGSFVKPISERKFRFIPIGRFFGENSGARISWCLLIYMYIYIYIYVYGWRVKVREGDNGRLRRWLGESTQWGTSARGCGGLNFARNSGEGETCCCCRCL